jgi:light-regulated signal transduction histidine kinase (bacteriophytochrome)
MYSYLKKEPVSFVLEGVVGFNLASAAEIRQLRENLHQAESKYRVEKEELDSHLDNTQALVTQAAEVLEREELKTQTMEEQLATKQKQLQALRDLVDQNTRQLAQARKLVSIKKKKVCVRVCVCVCARAFL